MVQILKREAVLIQGELVCDGVQNVFHDRPGISIFGSQSPSIEIHHACFIGESVRTNIFPK